MLHLLLKLEMIRIVIVVFPVALYSMLTLSHPFAKLATITYIRHVLIIIIKLVIKVVDPIRLR